MAMAWALAAAPAGASGTTPEITAAREGRGATITLRHGELTIVQRLGERTLHLSITEGRDELRVSADLDGRVTLERAGTRRTFEVRSATLDDQAALNALLSGSAAMTAFDRVLELPWARSEMAAPFRTTREAIRALQGDYNVVSRMAAVVSTPRTQVMFARQRLSPSQCWDTYARDVTKYTYDLQSCLSNAYYAWWNPLHSAWCTYEYNLKSSLAAVWLLDCYGVPI
jgi:hypothetical protein